jgi:hypothetical protein
MTRRRLPLSSGRQTVAAVVLACVSLLVACSSSHPGADPGNRRLHQLAAEPVLQQLPPGSTKLGEQQVPAHWVTPAFGAGGSQGALVEVTFTSTASIVDVYTDIRRRAEASGWVAVTSDSTGLTNAWSKPYSDAVIASLRLSRVDPRRTAPPITYSLAASA